MAVIGPQVAQGQKVAVETQSTNDFCIHQGDRILSCPGEYRQQVVFVETTEKSFPSQTHLMCMLLPQQIECNVPHRSYICRGMVLPNAAAIFVEGHI